MEKNFMGNFSGAFAKIFTAFLALVLTVYSAGSAGAAGDSSEAFMSATFGLTAARTQKRMENSGAVLSEALLNSMPGGRLTMKGTFEQRAAIFSFGFSDRKRLTGKSVHIASTGDAGRDKALYDALRQAYNASFGSVSERMVPNRKVRGRIALQNSWRPDKTTIISLYYDPEITVRFPGSSLDDHPIRLSYTRAGA